MEQLLEAISDAVSSMVLYSVEADESNAAIPNILPGAQGVKSTVDYLVDLAGKSAVLWDNFNQPDMKEKMLATCESIRESTGFLLESATILSNMPFNKPAKKTLLKGAKGIMEHMVVLLQQADLYEVTRLIRYCRKTESKLKIFIGLEPGETYFATAAQDFVTSTVDVGKIVTKRINEIDDYGLKKRFEEATSALKVEVPVVLQYFAYYQRDPNDKNNFNLGHKTAKTIFDLIEEIITVARLSAKSPFDLSMIQGLDLRDEDDLRDANILIAQEREKLLSAIQAGDGKEASRALKAIKKGLNDQIIITKALAKSADNPIQRKRLEDASLQAQRVLDSIVAQFGQAVEELLSQPDNSILLERLRMNLDTIKSASDQMVTSSARLSSNDVAEAQKILEDLVEKCKANIDRSEIDKLKVNVPLLSSTFNDVIELAESISKSTEDPLVKSLIENATVEARKRGSALIGTIERLTRDLERDPNNKDVASQLHQALIALEQVGKDVVKATSLGTSNDIYQAHNLVHEELGKLKQAILEGNKKEMQASLRAVRKAMNDEVNLAKSLLRVTEDQQMREALQAVILKADQDLNDMITDLYSSATAAIEDPNNPSAIEKLDQAINEIDQLNSNFLGAVSRDLMANNTKELEAKLTQLVHSIKNGDQQESVAVLKGIVENIKKQALFAELASGFINEQDPHRATRIKERALDLSNTGPDLVKAVKANLVEMNAANLQALAQSINTVRETNRDLNNAVLLTTEEELMENSAKIDQEARRIQANLERGLPINMNEVNSLMKKMNNQIRLAHQHANAMKDPNSKKLLLDSTNNLNKIVSLLVDACKNSAANPNDEAAKKQVKDLLDAALRANMELIGGSFSTADELVYGTPNLLKLISRLEEALLTGDPDEIKRAFKELNDELTRQLFLARIAETSITDPERRKQLLDAINDLESLQNALYPSVMDFLNNPNSLEARDSLNQLLRQLKGGVERVSTISSANPSEHLETKSYTIANELNKVQKALDKNNANEANDSIQKALAGIKQQIQLSKHIADNTNSIPQKRAIIEISDKLEKQALVLQQAVKESIANPSDAKAKAKVAQATAETRVLMAQLIAASSNKVPEEQIIATANAIKKDIDNLKQVLASGKPQEINDAIKAFKSGEALQKLELLKAYNAKVQDPYKKRQIANAISDLEKKLNDSINYVDNTIGNNNPNAEQIKQLKNLTEQASASAEHVIKASTPSHEDRILSQAVKISETLDNINSSSKKGKKADVDANVRQLREEVGDTIQLIKQASEASKDKQKQVALNEVAEKLKNVTQQIGNAANNAVDKPTDAALQKQLVDLGNQAKELLAKAVNNSSNSENPNQLLESIVFKASNDINRMASAAESGDSTFIGDAVTNLQDTEKRIKILSQIPNANIPQAALKSLEQTIPTIIANGNVLLTQPKDAAAKQSVPTHSQKAIEDLSSIISATNSAPEDKIIGNGAVINRELDQLSTNSKKPNSKPAVQSNVDAAYKTVAEQSVLARALANQTSNAARKQELLNKAKELDKLLPQLDQVNQSIQQSSSPTVDKATTDKLDQIVTNIKASNQKVVAEAINEKLEKEAKERREREERERAEQERLQREKEEREKAEQDEVAKAALKIAERTKNLAKDNTSEGKLYSTAQGIAGIMRDLSIAAANNDKKGMIQCSKLLAEHITLYLQQAKETAAKCTDPKLKEQIITAAQAAKNWTVQLKIIAAVKAASEDDDSTSNKQQLVKCARGLAKAVVHTINAVEIGQIRAK
ncbi:hypothetical protein CYY_007966 [Polysphondylium violaceum]|uniref:Actin binding protein n=1 Tax=Polysphondylium violaceum TaxID=133409 RepID=A0A8J4V1R5_9MYCE|nr:hypothetical protein CYY_007966 [Polysphondylium violaceum]